ncbi:hypothetical protein WV31_10405 [Magnetospirillum sp. ME-1]|uniref:DnaB-like helicase C-terminal domain-containing protein n=1 Tax=Magnetospirillum sp. ME-1 TaxID=1639348 RepID=UPI000A17DCFD|nr:DnaB-like helicase C-terminal domain-containing protein [Magnetospirillum sp. ME-1]ARJ66038.1 hypothetical protein WV31_10405 [Magnetospirillum sp. ME-1]
MTMRTAASVRSLPGRAPSSALLNVPMPSDTDLEAFVLGGLLSSSASEAKKHVLALDETCFSDGVLRRLYSAALSVVMKGRDPSPQVVGFEIGRDALEAFGGSAFLGDLASRGEGSASCMADAIVSLRLAANRREAISAALELIAAASNEECAPEEAMSTCFRRLRAGMAQGGTGLMRTKREVAATAIDERLACGPAITTGIVELDKLILGGIRPRTFVVIESSYGSGKSALLATVSDNINLQGVKTLYITLESTAEELEMRMVARRMNLRMAWTFDESHEGFAMMRANRDAYVEQVPDNVVYLELRNPTVDTLHREILRAKHRYGIQVVILDYVQCIGGMEKGIREETFWFGVGRALRDIAKEEDLAILAAAQDDKRTAVALRQSSSLLLVMERDINDDAVHFHVEKTNDSPYGRTDRGTHAPIILDPAGPHVRDARGEDITTRIQRDLERGVEPQE